MIGGQKTEISYEVKYFLESYELELRVYKYNEDVVSIFEEVLNKDGYLIKKKLPIGDPVYSLAIYSEGKNQEQFCSTYMNILDEIIKLPEE